MDTVPFRRCTACRAVIEPGEEHWTNSGNRSHPPHDFCTMCVGLKNPPWGVQLLGQLLDRPTPLNKRTRGRR